MRVVLDALWLDPGRSGGTETYLRGLAPALASEFPMLDLHVATTRRGATALAEWETFATVHRYPADEGERPSKLVAEQVLLPLRAGRAIVHGLVTGPLVTRGPLVMTVHDATFLRTATFSRSTTLAMKWIIGGAARRAGALVSGSAAAADECATWFGLNRDRIAVVPHGAGRVPSVAPSTDIRDRLGLPAHARIVLCVAAIRPHKNQAVLVAALDHLPPDVRLVLAGAPEPYAQTLAHQRLVMPGYVSDADLEALWREAGCAAFPTLGEGFGLPVLEAMQRGVPVACSNLPVLREVGGDVPAYFDPHDARSVAEAVLRAVAGQEGGPTRAARFSWKRAAQGTYAAYERALSAAA